MKHGARNDIPARIVAIKRGDVMAQVDVELVGTAYHMSSVMTVDSLDEMGLQEGDTIRVLAKAVNVLLVKP
ncbi:TOBE domain-containing protein [Methylobacterium trifolii]|uniref:Molybdenum-pterin-binding protein 2 n=1 Tax=Methylobacterium trifolii TaxID=1003092 RepID=A0ABQ4U0D7_9HYPH|nr:TOBE domain-containing protein [Methylobacterium trifolii]GJE60929.1 Molybdenum-pterin-binding protein 2 [Methylobacterium trifolii]